MLFGNEKRFSKTLVTSGVDAQVMGVKSESTDSSLGPGTYYNNHTEERRGGWASTSFSKRSPMTPSAKARGPYGNEQSTGSLPGLSAESRDLYQSAVMTPYGAIAMPPSPKHNGLVPGPGYYDPDLLTTFGSPKLHVKSGSPASRTPRFAFSNSTVMKDGVMFQSAENEKKEIGPGYYAVERDQLNKPSFNVRASKGKASLSQPGSASNSRPRTPNRLMSRDNSAGNLNTSAHSSGSACASPHTPRGQYVPSPHSAGRTGNARNAVAKHRQEFTFDDYQN